MSKPYVHAISPYFGKYLQRAAGSSQNNSNNKEYDRLLGEAVKLGKQHETKAKYFVSKMYDALVKEEGLVPSDAADRIYKDLVGIWQKDTIRRLLPPEAKNQVAREMQALSRFPLESKAVSILGEREAADNDEGRGQIIVATLEEENAKLKRAVEELESAKKSLLERTLRLEKLLAEEQQLRQQQQQLHHQRDLHSIKGGEEAAATTIVLPPRLFMKVFALMRGSTKPLVMKVMAKEVLDIDKMNEWTKG